MKSRAFFRWKENSEHSEHYESDGSFYDDTSGWGSKPACDSLHIAGLGYFSDLFLDVDLRVLPFVELLHYNFIMR